MVDSSGKYDTLDIHYKALKAYITDDSVLLKKLDSSISNQMNNRADWDLWTSDIPLPKLNQLNKDEAYRFIFSILGSPAYEAITISQKDTSFKLHYLFYRHDRDLSKFDKIREFEKSISETQWNDLTTKITQADFWGLINDKESRGRDGNDLTVIGYVKSGDYERSHFVHRWTNTTLNDAFYYVYYNLLDKTERQLVNK
ncbi:hypothetical protein QTN47_21465 [Danxiaibacter flavus]|uniref:DUF4268 domain-containing protein n=1 Tax=Danxiaibacter flavus TaxID=3049108 RepID=A0ABV3ZJP4_9BACT|nr:hypothetical protein QNM32_21470 [Chitinophagaceae bacterium DXS]